MLPLKLQISNFCCYEKAEIDFSLFSSALVVGKIINNDKLSNGAGKSTIFAAIKYVLFNETNFSTLDKIIRNGSDLCSVAFEFDVDNTIYKIIRNKTIKSEKDVRLFKKNADSWEDLTQRRPSDTEQDIAKIIKINYKTFSNSVLFSQLDLSGLASLTPAPRKAALKDALQLHIYSKYEAITKKRIPAITKNIDEVNANIKILNVSKEYFDKIISDDKKISERLENIKISANESSLEFNDKKNELNNFSIKLNNFETTISSLIKDKEKISCSIELYNKDLIEYEKKIKDIGVSGNDLYKKILILDKENLDLKYNENSIDLLKKEHDDNELLILDAQSNLNSLHKKYEELLVPIPDHATCNYCRQSITNDAREACRQSIEIDLSNVKKNIQDLKLKLKKITDNKKNLLNKINDLNTTKDKILTNKNLILRLRSEIDSKKTLYIDYSDIIKSNKLKISNLKSDLNIIEQELSSKNIEDLNVIKNNISMLEKDLSILKNDVENNNNMIISLSSDKAVIDHKIKEYNKDIIKLDQFLEKKKILEKDLTIHQKVIDGFSSSGIPALIIHNILDDLQSDTNIFLSELRPGMQVIFSIVKDRDDGQQEETLNIDFLLNGVNLEYEQLSGAQKIITALALKLGLLSIIKKRLGVDIKLLMIDEVDQSLDDGGLEAFEMAVKKLQKDYKVLVITHNKKLKHKFSQAILVEQNEKGISTAQVVNAW